MHTRNVTHRTSLQIPLLTEEWNSAAHTVKPTAACRPQAIGDASKPDNGNGLSVQDHYEIKISRTADNQPGNEWTIST